MEIINFRTVERSTQDVSVTINRGSSERWAIQSQKTKYVNGKTSGVIGVGYTASINNSNYLLKEDKSNNEIQITALADDGTSGTCVLTQNESGNRINLKITTPDEREYWEIHFNPIPFHGVDSSDFFAVVSNISGENGFMSPNDTTYKNWIVNQNRYMLNIYISYAANILTVNSDMLSWSCFDKNGNAFISNYNLPSNSDLTIKTTGLSSYTLTKVSSAPPVNNDTPILSSRFNPTKKYPLDLNFYWVDRFTGIVE